MWCDTALNTLHEFQIDRKDFSVDAAQVTVLCRLGCDIGFEPRTDGFYVTMASCANPGTLTALSVMLPKMQPDVVLTTPS